MAGEDAIYIGLRCSGSFGARGAPTVVGVREGSRSRTLEKHPEARLPDAFDWGYEGVGPKVLAQAILADRLGVSPDPPITAAFAREVVAHLDGDFELRGSHVDEWVSHRLAATRQ
jgi:hypothetical protein